VSETRTAESSAQQGLEGYRMDERDFVDAYGEIGLRQIGARLERAKSYFVGEGVNRDEAGYF